MRMQPHCNEINFTFHDSRPGSGWQQENDDISNYVFTAISHHCKEALEQFDDGVWSLAFSWLTKTMEPTEMLTDIIW